MIDSDWDVDKYKNEFECDEHWRLRKNFLLAHKEKFPEDRLVCLAQIFYNVEFMGCRYPEGTMKLVAELSKDVAHDHREKQKRKLKQIFVQASDGVAVNVKDEKVIGVQHERGLSQWGDQYGPNTGKTIPSYGTDLKGGGDVGKINDLLNMLEKIRSSGGLPSRFVLREDIPDKGKQYDKTIRETSAAWCGMRNKVDFDPNTEMASYHVEPISGGAQYLVAKCFSKRKIRALLKVNKKALQVFQMTCFSLREKQSSCKMTVAKILALRNLSLPAGVHVSGLGLNNDLACKGWTGGGFGKLKLEPQQSYREKRDRINITSVVDMEKFDGIMTALNEYASRPGTCSETLVISLNSVGGTRIIKNWISTSGLFSKTFGPHHRRIMLYKLDPWEMVKEIIAAGGESSTHTLTPPTSFEDAFHRNLCD